MSHLITCPKCGGTGQIKRPESAIPTKSKGFSNFFDDNLRHFSETYGATPKGKPAPFKTCPECKGFGMVRG